MGDRVRRLSTLMTAKVTQAKDEVVRLARRMSQGIFMPLDEQSSKLEKQPEPKYRRRSLLENVFGAAKDDDDAYDEEELLPKKRKKNRKIEDADAHAGQVHPTPEAGELTLPATPF